jgi:ACS family D-galactonate transporter-like MFS transporter
LLDRFGVKTIGRIGAILWSAATFMAATAPGVKVFFGTSSVLGVGEAPTFPANSKAIGYWFPRHERSLATAIFDSAAKFSTAVGTPIIGLLLIHFGWRFSFGVTGAINFIYFLAFYFFTAIRKRTNTYRSKSADISSAAAPFRQRLNAIQGAAHPYFIYCGSGR